MDIQIDFPYDVEQDFGEVKSADALFPGVYYVSALAVEYYIAEKDTKCLSAEHPELLTYRLDEPESGATIVKYECQKYCISHNLPLPERITRNILAIIQNTP